LVVLAIIGILVGLLLPAVQAAREAGRKAICASNLHQIGTALATYESQWQRFPPDVLFGPPGSPPQDYSAFVRILPMLEQTPLYNAVNMSVPLNAPDPLPGPGDLINSTASQTRLAVLLCPSDAQQEPVAPTNYRLCEGRGPHWEGPHLWGGDAQGPFFGLFDRSAADFTDGLSNTALVSERCLGAGVETYADFFRDVLPGNPDVPLSAGQPYSGVCQASASWPFALVHPFVQSGWTWFARSLNYTSYDHCMTPNAVITDCGDAVTARSYHPGGVHLLAADGGVRFVRNGIDPRVWWALATLSAGDGPAQY
ncbi:MAG: DUF1559 domain-containing protein, partial [Isosphaeraceae bacterium]